MFGLFAIVDVISGTVVRRNSWKVIFPVMLVQMFVMGLVLRASPIPREMGAAEINRLQSRPVLDARMTIGGVVLAAYVCLIYVFISEGRRYLAVYAEMELDENWELRFSAALYPAGRSVANLIDVVGNGDKWIAYIADVSGHDVAPGVLTRYSTMSQWWLLSDPNAARVEQSRQQPGRA